MSVTVRFYTVIIVLLVILGIGIYRFKTFDNGSRILCVLLGVCAFTETIGYICAIKYQTNLLLFNFYDLAEFFLLCLYFNATIDVFTNKRIGIYLGFIGIVIGLLTMSTIHPDLQINTYFIFFESFCITGMSLFAFYKILLNNEQLYLTRYPHFWFTATLLLSWNISVVNWGTYDLLSIKFPGIVDSLNNFNWLIDILSYVAFGIIFLFYPKMQAKDE